MTRDFFSGVNSDPQELPLATLEADEHLLVLFHLEW
jgi:hypothetical protein